MNKSINFEILQKRILNLFNNHSINTKNFGFYFEFVNSGDETIEVQWHLKKNNNNIWQFDSFNFDIFIDEFIKIIELMSCDFKRVGLTVFLDRSDFNKLEEKYPEKVDSGIIVKYFYTKRYEGYIQFGQL